MNKLIPLLTTRFFYQVGLLVIRLSRPLLVCAALLVVAHFQGVPAAQAQTDEYYVIYYDTIVYDTGILIGCQTVNYNNIGTFETEDDPIRGYVYNADVTVTDVIGGTWALGLFTWNGVSITPTNNRMTDTAGANRCYATSGHSGACAELGFMYQAQINNTAPTNTTVEVDLQVEINCGTARRASWELITFGVIYFGTPPDPDPPELGFIRPLTEPDEDNALQDDNYALYDSRAVEARAEIDNAPGFIWGVYNGLWIGNQHTVQGWSDQPGAKVHAAVEGQIESIQRLTWVDCGLAYFQYDIVELETLFYQLKTTDPAPCMVGFLDPEAVETAPAAQIWDNYYLDTRDMFIVTLRYTTEQRFVYLVRNADQYAVAGDQVDAGCVLGETAPLTTVPVQDDRFLEAIGVATSVTSLVPGLIGVVSTGINVAVGVFDFLFPPELPPPPKNWGYMNMSLMGEDDQPVTLLDSLTELPTNDSACSETEGYRDCLADNPRMMNDGFGWTADGNVTWTNPGVVLDPNESVTATLNLNPSAEYTVTFFGQSSDGLPGEARVFLGNNSETVNVLQEWSSESVEFTDLGNPNAGFFYTVGIQNTGDVPLEVNSLCVTDGEPNIAPHSCYFNNYSFDMGLSGWTGSEGIELQDGSLLVPDDGTFSQNVTLEPETYILKVKAAYWYTGPLEPNSILASVSYKWPDTESYIDLQPAPIEGYSSVGGVAVWVEGTITVEEVTDSDMEFLITTFSGGETDVLGLQVLEACLTPEDGTWPGYEGGVPPPIQASCSYISRPTTGDTAAWLQWHWANLNKFFKCDLMKLLNRMYTVMRDTYTLLGWLGRYSIGYANYASIWSGSNLFPWLNGHFQNMAIGQITTIEQGGQVSVWDVLLALVNNIFGPIVGMMGQIVGLIIGLVTQAANLLFTVLTAIISIVLAILTQLFSLLNLGLQLLGTLITAFNTATPEPIPGIPACGLNPQDGGICVFVWIADNTIFSGPGAAIIPLLVSILSIHLILWVVGEFKRAVVSVGSAS